MKWKCPICGKEFKNFGIKEFAQCPKTTLFGNFKRKTLDGEFQIVNRLINKPVCSEECKKRNEDKYFVEEYAGSKIYCVDGKYLPYLECDYWYNSIEGAKERIDNPHLVPITPDFLNGLRSAISGEPGNIK